LGWAPSPPRNQRQKTRHFHLSAELPWAYKNGLRLLTLKKLRGGLSIEGHAEQPQKAGWVDRTLKLLRLSADKVLQCRICKHFIFQEVK